MSPNISKIALVAIFYSASCLPLVSNSQPTNLTPSIRLNLFHYEGKMSLTYKHRTIDLRSDSARNFQKQSDDKSLRSEAMQKLSQADRDIVKSNNSVAEAAQKERSDTGTILYDGIQISLDVIDPVVNMPMQTTLSEGSTFQQNGDVTFLFKKVELLPLHLMPPIAFNLGVYNPVGINDSHQLTYRQPWLRNTHPFGSIITYYLKDALPLVTKVVLGDENHPYATMDYSEHKRIGNVWLPTKITRTTWMSASYNPGDLTKSYLEEWVITDFSDQKTSIPDPMNHLAKGALVQDDDGKSVVSFEYDPSKSIEDQHALALATQQALNDAPRQELKKRLMSSSSVLLIAGIALLGYWTWKRAKSRQGSLAQ